MGFFSGIGKAIGSIVGAVTDPIGSVLGAGLGYLGQESANSANAAASSQQMAFQERMSNTSYQRAVKDMQAAGLNPMLAYSQGGASAPLGSMPSIQNSAAGVSSGISSAIQAKQIETNLKQVQSQTELNDALKAKASADALYSISSAKQADAQAGVAGAQKATILADLPRKSNAARVESGLIGKGGAYVDRVLSTVNKLPILNWFSSKD